MKMNKLAAGALALALGLGAVAPAVAAENTGAELVLERYEKELKAANEAYKAFLDAEEKLDVAEKELDEAEAERAAAQAAYEAYFPKFSSVYDEKGEVIPVATLALRQVEDAAGALNAVSTKEVSAAKDIKIARDLGKKEAVEKMLAHVEVNMKDGVRPEQFQTALDRYVDAIYEYSVVTRNGSDLLQAYQNLKAAELKKTAKNTAYKTALEAYNEAEEAYEAALEVIRDRAEQYGLVVQVGANGVQIVKPEDDKVKAPGAEKSQAELIAELKAAIKKNEVAIASAEFLLENAPKSVAKVKAKLEKQIVDAKAIIAKSEAALAKLEGKVALIATAYANEDVSDDELESLIKENEDAANAINETIKENEEAQPEVEETEDDEAPEKEEEEAPEKEEEKKPAKKAGNNARTGIAGVAGVAGILAAASVAYAASKRD